MTIGGTPMDSPFILSLLMQQECVSADWLAGQLGITATAVQKSVNELINDGYRIERIPENCYRLIPPDHAIWPMCIRRTLHTKWAGSRIDYYDTIDSTNRAAKDLSGLAPSVAPHGSLVIADEQTSGRGRMDRTWSSEKGDSALMSLLLRPRHVSLHDATGIVLTAALSVVRTCQSFGAAAKIKWPNDIVCNGRKLSGMLLDVQGTEESVTWAVVGIGLNISGCPRSESLPHATYLNEASGKSLDRADVVAMFLNTFESFYDRWTEHGVDAIIREYRDSCVTIGSSVRVIGLNEEFDGTAMDVNQDGSLTVRKKDGSYVSVHAGDVSVRGIMGYI